MQKAAVVMLKNVMKFDSTAEVFASVTDVVFLSDVTTSKRSSDHLSRRQISQNLLPH